MHPVGQGAKIAIDFAEAPYFLYLLCHTLRLQHTARRLNSPPRGFKVAMSELLLCIRRSLCDLGGASPVRFCAAVTPHNGLCAWRNHRRRILELARKLARPTRKLARS